VGIVAAKTGSVSVFALFDIVVERKRNAGGGVLRGAYGSDVLMRCLRSLE